MLRKWTRSGAFFPSLIPGSLCLGPPPQSWVWTTRKTVRSSGLESLLLCYHSAQLSKMLLINSSMIFRPLIYLRVNISNLLLPLQSGTKWDSLVMRTRSRSSIQILQKSVLLLNPLGPYGQGSPTNSQGIGTSS